MTTLEELEAQKSKLEEEIKELKRQARRRTVHLPTEQEKAQEQEFNRQQLAGKTPMPLVPRVDLESLVGSEAYERTLTAEAIRDTYITTLRGITLKYKAPNRRALWQSAGQEYIEPDLLDFIDTIEPEETYFDIGASTGIFAIYAAARGINTVCFEPEVQNFNLLNFNSFLNNEQTNGKIKNFNLALSDTDGVDEMYIKKFEEAGHLKILGSPQARGESNEFTAEYRQSVLTLRLDTFMSIANLSLPTHLKIDIDGAEKKLLLGMGDLLANRTIRSICIEILDNDQSSLHSLDILKSHGFEITHKVRVQNYFGEHNYFLQRH